ncbi:MAG: hypothetical protein AB8I08_17630 [Sandaracinaceae bacterium]
MIRSLWAHVHAASPLTALFLGGALLAGCGSSGDGASGPANTTVEASGEEGAVTSGPATSDSETSTVGAPPRVPGYFDAEGAPHPLACEQDSDCAYGGILAANGCCWSFVDANAAPMSAAYRAWGMARRTACGDDCPPPPVPTQPPSCLFEVRCDSGACTNACP